jgi:hypothetical protein
MNPLFNFEFPRQNQSTLREGVGLRVIAALGGLLREAEERADALGKRLVMLR